MKKAIQGPLTKVMKTILNQCMGISKTEQSQIKNKKLKVRRIYFAKVQLDAKKT